MHALCRLSAKICRRLNDRPTPRNYLKESRELKNFKELNLAYPCDQSVAILLTRKISPPRKRTLILHDLALGMFPVLLTFHGTLALEDGESSTFKISTGIYIFLMAIVISLTLLSREFTGAPVKHWATLCALIGLITFSLMPVFLHGYGWSSFWQLGGTLLSAAGIVLISQKFFSLPDSFRQAAKKSSKGE